MDEKSYSPINLFIRSFIFSIYSLISIPLYSFLVLFASPFSIHRRHALIRGFLYAYMYVLKKLCHVNYEVIGLENIPKDRVGVVMSKHQSTWETFFLPTVFHDPAIIIKHELLWLPFFGWGLALSDPIAINRKDKSSAMQQVIEKGKKRLQDGRWILVFPEGTRVAAGVIGNYRLGGARLAVETGFPIIPVAHNAGEYWPKRTFIKRPGTIKVVIGPIIETQNKSPEEVLEKTKHWIETTMLQISRKK